MLFRKKLLLSIVVISIFMPRLQAQFTELNNPIPEEKKWNFWVDASVSYRAPVAFDGYFSSYNSGYTLPKSGMRISLTASRILSKNLDLNISLGGSAMKSIDGYGYRLSNMSKSIDLSTSLTFTPFKNKKIGLIGGTNFSTIFEPKSDFGFGGFNGFEIHALIGAEYKFSNNFKVHAKYYIPLHKRITGDGFNNYTYGYSPILQLGASWRIHSKKKK